MATEHSLRFKVTASVDSTSIRSAMAEPTKVNKSEQKKREKDETAHQKLLDKLRDEALHRAIKNAGLQTAAELKAHRDAEAGIATIRRKMAANYEAMRKKDVADAKRAEDQKVRDVEAAAKKAAQIAKKARAEVDKANRPPPKGPAGPRTFADRALTSVGIRLASAAAAFPMRLAGDIASGFGIDHSVSGQLQGAVKRETMATNIANAGWVPGSRRQWSGDIERGAYEVGTATGTKTDDVLAGLEKFKDLTGDLKLGQEIMLDIGKLAKSNGADFTDMAMAAGEISNALGDIPNKAKAIQGVLRGIAGQGQIGAIEIKDQAKYFATIASQSNFFHLGDRSKKTLSDAGVEDEGAQRLLAINALAQMTRSHGGRATAKMADKSAEAFVRDMMSPTEIKRMEAQGLKPWGDEGKTFLKSPDQMIAEMLRASATSGGGGINLDTLRKLNPNQNSFATTRAFATTYEKAYEKSQETDENKRHLAAQQAVVDEYQHMLAAAQSVAENNERFATALATSESQANIVNNEFGLIASRLRDDLMPALKDIADWVHAFTGKESTTVIASGRAIEDADTLIKPIRARLAEANTQYDPKDFGGVAPTGDKPFESLSSDQADLGQALKTIDKAVQAQRASVEKAGNATTIAGAKISSLSPEALQDMANAKIPNPNAREYLQGNEKLQKLLEQQQLTMNTLAEVMSNLAGGKVIKVHKVKDDTKAPAGAKPKTSGTAGADASVRDYDTGD